MLAAGALQVFGKRQLAPQERTPGAQRPQHAKQQAVDVLGGNAADDAGSAQFGAPLLFQGLYFVGQLAQRLVDAFGFAAGTGGTQAQVTAVEIEVCWGQGRVVQRLQLMILRLITDPQIDFVMPAQAGLGLQVGGQQHVHAGTPGAEQRYGQQCGIFQVHGQASYATALKARGQLQGLRAELRVVQCRVEGDRARRIKRVQELPRIQPLHERPRTRCLISHSAANNRPIRP
ncbi:hypothetical protein D3C77_260590 [compost metagenome]